MTTRYVIQARTLGIGRYENDRWVSSEPEGQCTRVTTAFSRPVYADSKGDPVPSHRTAKFDTMLLLAPPHPRELDVYAQMSDGACQAAWTRGAAGCVIHYLYPWVGGPKSAADLSRVNIADNAQALREVLDMRLCGSLLIAPTAATPQLHDELSPHIRALLVSVLNELQHSYVAEYEQERVDNPSATPRVCPPIGIVGHRGADLLSLWEVGGTVPASFVPANAWIRAADPMGIGASVES